jgi:hypothetical protein
VRGETSGFGGPAGQPVIAIDNPADYHRNAVARLTLDVT